MTTADPLRPNYGAVAATLIPLVFGTGFGYYLIAGAAPSLRLLIASMVSAGFPIVGGYYFGWGRGRRDTLEWLQRDTARQLAAAEKNKAVVEERLTANRQQFDEVRDALASLLTEARRMKGDDDGDGAV